MFKIFKNNSQFSTCRCPSMSSSRRCPSVVPPRPCSSVSSFTLIELIVVISLIAFFAGLLIANYHTGERISNLLTETQKIAGVFKQAQNMALTGESVSGSRPDRGYGVYVGNLHSYKLFADTSATSTYAYDSGDKVIQNFTTPSTIEISSSATSTVFVPPDATIYTDGSPASGISTVTIHQTESNRYLYIRVDASSGRIDIVSSL